MQKIGCHTNYRQRSCKYSRGVKTKTAEMRRENIQRKNFGRMPGQARYMRFLPYMASLPPRPLKSGLRRRLAGTGRAGRNWVEGGGEICSNLLEIGRELDRRREAQRGTERRRRSAEAQPGTERHRGADGPPRGAEDRPEAQRGAARHREAQPGTERHSPAQRGTARHRIAANAEKRRPKCGRLYQL